MTQDLSQLETKALLELMMDDLYDGLAEAVAAEVEECLRRGISPFEVMTEGLAAGMEIVGVDFRDGVLFVPEVLLAAKGMKAGMDILRPLLAESGASSIGRAVIGTVKGDIHDIGKNLVKMMWEGAGIEVFDVGINAEAEAFIGALQEHEADILGMSALLTTTMPIMKQVAELLRERGLADQVRLIIGGAPITDEYATQIGADAYGFDAVKAVEIVDRLTAKG